MMGARWRLWFLVLLAAGVGCGEESEPDDSMTEEEPGPTVDAALPDAATADSGEALGKDSGTGLDAGVDAGLDAARPLLDGGGIRLDGSLPPRMPPPRSTARIVGRVLSTDGLDLESAVVSADGLPVLTDAFGGFELDEVFGTQTARVVVRAPHHMPTEFDVPLREGEVSNALAYVQPLDAELSHDPADAMSLSATTQADLRLPKGALLQPWGQPAAGKVTVEFAGLAQGGTSWAALPGDGTLADGTLLELVAGFYLNARQGATSLALDGPAAVRYRFSTVPLTDPAPDAGVPERTLTLYRYEQRTGHFEAVSEIRVIDDTFEVTVSSFGTYALGAPMATEGCARVRVEDEAGGPAGHAAVRYHSPRHAGLVTADEDGSVCVRGPLGVTTALAYRRDGASRQVSEPLWVPIEQEHASGAVCDDTCGAVLPLPLAERPIGCIAGAVFAAPGASGRVDLGFDTETVNVTVQAGETFCRPVLAGRASVTGAGAMACMEGRLVTIAVGSCGAGTCTALGDVRCCGDTELCETAGWDDDCDDVVDEGCLCGVDRCDTQTRHRGCCTAEDLCGIEGVAEDSCFEYMAPGDPISPTCADETVAFEDYNLLYTGCCRPDGRCGLEDTYYGCVAREELHEAVPALMTFPAATCD